MYRVGVIDAVLSIDIGLNNFVVRNDVVNACFE